MPNKQPPELTYNDPVRVNCPVSKYDGMEGFVVGLPAKNCPIYTVEFAGGESDRFSRDMLLSLINIWGINVCPYEYPVDNHTVEPAEFVWCHKDWFDLYRKRPPDTPKKRCVPVVGMVAKISFKFTNESSTHISKDVLIRGLRYIIDHMEKENSRQDAEKHRTMRGGGKCQI